MRVATVITRFNGGAGLVALNSALALESYEHTVITGGTGIDSTAKDGGPVVLRGEEAVAAAATGDLTPQAHKAGVEIIQVRDLVPEISPRTDLAARRILTRLLRDGHYDVVHTHSAKAGFLGRLAAARAGVPRIVHTWHGFYWSDFHSWPRRRAYIAMERRAARHTDAFLAIGTATATTALELGLTSPERVRVCWPAVSQNGTTGEPGLARELLGLPSRARVVGSVGRAAPQKAPEVFAAAVARLPDDVHGVWIGGGPQLDEMKRRTARLSRMHWAGHRDDVPALLPGLDVLALASRWEGVPCVLAEATAAGVPLAGTTVPCVPDFILPGVTGMLAPPDDPAGLATAIRHLLDNPAEAHRMVTAARQWIGTRCTPQVHAALLAETYQAPSRRPG